MNKVILAGRLTADPDVRYSGEMCVARYRLAVDRRTARNADGHRETDFINCVAFRKSGEFAEKYLQKGMKIMISGRIQTGSYKDKEGRTVYTTDVVVEEQEFAESKSASASQETQSQEAQDFVPVPDDMDDLPFN